ncbi:MAG: asparagine--tRNA ligase [Gammaproteobacteria bacterium]|nr:asparagine--tRNA ligase [Gammaproteobacteria bacterium]
MEQIREFFLNEEKYSEKIVTLTGWIRNNRSQKEYGFIDLNDGTSFKNVQVVYEENLDNFKDVQKMRNGASIEVEGKFVLTPERNQKFEIKATRVTLLGESTPDYPIQPKRHSREFLRELPHLRVRTNLFQAVFRVRNEAAFAIHKFFQEKGFIYVHTPIITSNDGEGAGQLFSVSTDSKHPYTDFFGKNTYLTVTGQLHVEPFAMAFRNVYTFGPAFRAENSNTQKHASEFWMVEPEMAFCDLKGEMDIVEELVKYVIKDVLENSKEEMEFFNNFVEKGLINRLNAVLNSEKFARVTHHDTITLLRESGVKFENEPKYGEDIAREHEKWLTEHFNGPVFVYDWPKDIKAFYMKVNEDGKTVAASDLLVPESGELVGGSQREERLDVLLKRMEELGMKEETLDWYVDTRRYGGCVHSGFGLGFERLIMFLTGVDNIRDVEAYPRTPNNCEF